MNVCCCSDPECRRTGCKAEKNRMPVLPAYERALPGMPRCEPLRPLTEADVRRIVREEIVRAMGGKL